MKIRIHKLFIILLFCFVYSNGSAQSIDTSRTEGVPQKDIVDVAKQLLRKDSVSFLNKLSIKVGRLYLSLFPAAGYTLLSKIGAVVSTNYAFYTDSVETNLSVVKFVPLYTFTGELILPIKSNIWTAKNKYNITSDYRYYKFPEFTYGLGGRTTLKNSQQLNYYYLSLRQAILKHMSDHFFIGLGYNLDYHWGIRQDAVNGEGGTSYTAYGVNSRSLSTGPTVNLLIDSRKNSINPEKGFYGSMIFCPSFTFLGSDKNWQSLVIDVRKYVKISGRFNNVLAFWSYSWFTFGGDPPYFDLPATGWDMYSNLGRGYIQSRFRGRNLLYLESEYRFGITRNGLLGGVLFANAQTVSEWPSNRFEKILPAVGAGLRVKLNKYSNTNVALDYGVGVDGSHGLFVTLGEVF